MATTTSTQQQADVRFTQRELDGARILCECLIAEGVQVIFGYPGGVLLPLYHVFSEYPEIRHILVRHEQAAAHAADGYARATNKVGVCMGTSGPGATNLVTGIATAMMDSAPVVALTGQVTRSLIGRDAFQETDITGITLPITKHNWLVMDTADLATTVKKAFHIAGTGRPGPVLVDIPKDVFTSKTYFTGYPTEIKMRGYNPTVFGHARQIKQAAKLINEAQRPVLLVGHGVTTSEAYNELMELAERAEIPVISTLQGLSSFPTAHPLSLGMPGMHGNLHANHAINESDVLIAMGMRFDDRVTGNLKSFARNCKIIHIDIDPAEIGKNVPVHIPIVGDVKKILQVLNLHVNAAKHTEWLEKITHWRGKDAARRDNEMARLGVLPPQFIIKTLGEVLGGDAVITTDVGQHQMYVAQHFNFRKANSLISSGGLGTMGFGLPSAMGAKMALGENVPVWTVTGDGGFQMNMQELATCVQEKINVKIAILNNGVLGMIRQWQQVFYDGRYHSTPITGPDFVKLAEAFGVRAWRVTHRDEVARTIQEANDWDGPTLIDFIIPQGENVFPMVPPGGSNLDAITEA
ncbi:biosynthetic-type acetolactate synthase large subunit [Candidatus Chlorohelix sp.]|uniref:biosynthetic-type acetolactate synthase large subunit n=1 Tax=Candidatus Chlorohelix sp. TaxID=3139201 RepID=UPI0030480CC2